MPAIEERGSQESQNTDSTGERRRQSDGYGGEANVASSGQVATRAHTCGHAEYGDTWQYTAHTKRYVEATLASLWPPVRWRRQDGDCGKGSVLEVPPVTLGLALGLAAAAGAAAVVLARGGAVSR
jgi:hypothetical protein